jgi:peptidoglycan hydrolase-like protein with peptidoglycan-binding domain
MKDPTTGKWVGDGLGDVGPQVVDIQKFLATHFAAYAGHLVATGTYDQATADAVSEMQRRYGLPVTGIFDYASKLKSHFIKAAAPAPKSLFFSVEGHMSDMWHGPVADTGTQLEAEGRVRHQPIGYQNGSIPFDNASGENELARLVGATTLDSGVAFPAGTPWILGGFSQGGIVITDFYINRLLPGCDLAWRLPDLRGVLAYGNPCRETGSVAPWSRGQGGPAANSGLDPLVRFGLPGYPEKPANWMDVYRKGDIFSDNEPTTQGKIKAAIYQVVARGDFWSSQASALAQIADAFKVPLDYVMGAFQAIISGLGFLVKQGDNPHYSPFDISGGLAWCRSILP